MLINLLIVALLCVCFISIAKKRELIQISTILFFVAQIGLAIWVCFNANETKFSYFTFDTLGIIFFIIMSIIGIITAFNSIYYLDDNKSIKSYKWYFISLITLNISLIGVYFSNNIIVSWLFIEATTIAIVGLIYYDRTQKALEATWKYIFVSSIGLVVAYLGILFLSATTNNELQYDKVVSLINDANPLYLKIAFILILIGYSSKMQLFPLFPVGIDANQMAPSPASGFISSSLIAGGFVTFFRMYKLFLYNDQIVDWVQNILILTGVISLIIVAIYMGRTNNYKRLLSYSNVQASSIVIIGLALGQTGMYAAIVYIIAHTLIKGCLFQQMAIIGKTYRSYQIGGIGNYIKIDPVGSLVIIISIISIIAIPPSILFKPTYIIFSQLTHNIAPFIIITLATTIITYWLLVKLIPILYKPYDIKSVKHNAKNIILSSLISVIIITTFIYSCSNIDLIKELINDITKL